MYSVSKLDCNRDNNQGHYNRSITKIVPFIIQGYILLHTFLCSVSVGVYNYHNATGTNCSMFYISYLSFNGRMLHFMIWNVESGAVLWRWSSFCVLLLCAIIKHTTNKELGIIFKKKKKTTMCSEFMNALCRVSQLWRAASLENFN